MIEGSELGGVCLNAGCIPSKSLLTVGYRFRNLLNEEVGISTSNIDVNVSKAQAWKMNNVTFLREGIEKLIRKNKITLIKGTAFIENSFTLTVTLVDGSINTHRYQHLILAMGGIARPPQNVAESSRILKSTEVLALQLEALPSKIAVISCDFIGVQVATAFQNLGVAVTLFMNDFAIDLSPDIKELLIQQLRDRGVQVENGGEPHSVVEKKSAMVIDYSTKKGEDAQIDVDYVIYSNGRCPNIKTCGIENINIDLTEEGYIKVDEQGRTSEKHIFAIGDLVPGEALAQKASYEGKIAAEAINGGSAVVDYYAMPTIMYANPEVARVGLSVKEARIQGYQLKIIDYKRPIEESVELIRIISRASDELILGVEMVGEQACEWCGQMTLAVEGGLHVEMLTMNLLMKNFFQTDMNNSKIK